LIDIADRWSTADLERGIAGGELRLHFQPLMGAHSRQCLGFEAPGGVDMLARLRSTWAPPAAATTFSAGMVVLGQTETLNRVLGRADQALHAAKDRGRDRDVVDSRG
jgi:GGDEF domain-containing protein